MKPVLPEKNTTKLPKRYWFTLIFMLFVTILLGIYVYTPTPPRAEDNIILLISATLFTTFVFLYWLLICFFNNYQQKLNIIKIHIITFYMILVSLLIYVYKQFELAPDFFPFAISAKYREAFFNGRGYRYELFHSNFNIYHLQHFLPNFWKKNKKYSNINAASNSIHNLLGNSLYY